jgi:hypothetical protein
MLSRQLLTVFNAIEPEFLLPLAGNLCLGPVSKTTLFVMVPSGLKPARLSHGDLIGGRPARPIAALA